MPPPHIPRWIDILYENQFDVDRKFELKAKKLDQK